MVEKFNSINFLNLNSKNLHQNNSYLKRKLDKKFTLKQINTMNTKQRQTNSSSFNNQNNNKNIITSNFIETEFREINTNTNKNKYKNNNNNDKTAITIQSQLLQSRCNGINFIAVNNDHNSNKNENKFSMMNNNITEPEQQQQQQMTTMTSFRNQMRTTSTTIQTKINSVNKINNNENITIDTIESNGQNIIKQNNMKLNKNLTVIMSPRWSKIKHLLAIFMIFIYNSMILCSAISTSQHGMKTEPIFLSTSAAFKFVVGQTIQLPCEVRTPGQYILAWKRGIAILTAGSVRVSPDPRISLVNGNTLQIRDAIPSDAGDYICQIATLEPKEIIHHVEILIPPKIHHVTNGGLIQVKKGSPVRLECSAQGNPTPNITWTRKNNILPNGEDRYVSNVYIIENMDRHKGGTYTCTANNGVGQPASSQIILHVLYPPEITVEKTVVHSGEGQEAILVCIVHGESQPEVSWLKDTMQIDSTERHIMESRGARHSLLIRKVHSTDFGNYTCQADNQLGKARKTISMTGKPNIPSFRSSPISQWKDRYNISWIVNSFAPIEEYKLFYRPTQNAVENSFDGAHNAISPQAGGISGTHNRNFPYLKRNDEVTPFMDSMLFHSGYSNTGGMHWTRFEWREIILQAMSTTSRYTQGMNYILRGLEPDQQYEAKVQARNRFGWSDFSDIFLFTTSNTDTEMRDLSVTHYSSTSSSSSLFPWSSFSSTASTIMFSHHNIINYSVVVLICISFLFL